MKKEVSSGQPVGSSLGKNGQNSFLVAYLIRISWWLRWKCTCNWCKQKRNFHKVHFSRFFLSKTYFWTFRLIFNFLLMENLTDIYISQLICYAFVQSSGFCMILEKILVMRRLGWVTSVRFMEFLFFKMYSVWSEIGNSTRIYSLYC